MRSSILYAVLTYNALISRTESHVLRFIAYCQTQVFRGLDTPLFYCIIMSYYSVGMVPGFYDTHILSKRSQFYNENITILISVFIASLQGCYLRCYNILRDSLEFRASHYASSLYWNIWLPFECFESLFFLFTIFSVTEFLFHEVCLQILKWTTEANNTWESML